MNKKILSLLILILIVGGLVGVYFFTLGSRASPSGENEESVSLGVETETDVKLAVESDHTVVLTNGGFSPENLLIKKGETVIWINESDKTATVNSDLHPSHLKYPPLNLGTFAIGEGLSLVFDEVGVFTYHNHLHPDYTGEITVE